MSGCLTAILPLQPFCYNLMKDCLIFQGGIDCFGKHIEMYVF